ncbi:MAG TPA: cytochrome P450 [Patescibacteria group bacterium]|nr:cytochrome P450 [Patescibacteria group bacterium]
MPADPPIAAGVSSSASGLPPGPKGLFLVGNAFQLSRDWMGSLTRCARQYGDVVFFPFLRTPVCLVSRPDLIESILVTGDRNFTKSRDYRAMRRVMGDGLLTSEGELWKRQRRLMQPAFHRERIESYAAIMTGYAERMLASWKDGEQRDVHEDMMRLTLEIAAQALFGVEISRDAQGVGLAVGIFVREFIGMASLAFVLPESIPVPGSGKLRRALRRLDEIIYTMIDERRAGADRPGDLLDMLIHAEDEQGRRMSDRQIRDEAVTLLLAGHETTALALSWTWLLLARHPEIAARLREELDRVLGGRAPAPGDLPRLRYAEMVIQESMRLYPPAWGIGRQAIGPFEIGGYRLPAGTNVLLCQWIVHRDPRFFPDPERFDPERWRGDPVRSGELPRFAYFPFGGGPRVCIGAAFAMMEAVLLLASIASKFQMALVPGHAVQMLPSITLRPKHGIRVRLARR